MAQRLFLKLEFEDTPSMFIKISDGVAMSFGVSYYAAGILQFNVTVSHWSDIVSDTGKNLLRQQFPGIVTISESEPDAFGQRQVVFIIAENIVKSFDFGNYDEDSEDVIGSRRYWSNMNGINYKID